MWMSAKLIQIFADTADATTPLGHSRAGVNLGTASSLEWASGVQMTTNAPLVPINATRMENASTLMAPTNANVSRDSLVSSCERAKFK